MAEPTRSRPFRERVAEEARRQKELRAAGQPIPSELRRYARISGGIIMLVAGAGTALVWGIGVATGSYYIFALLFMGVLALAGVAQLITGRHLLSRR